MTLDPLPTNFELKALPPALRAVSLVLSLAVIGAVLFQSVATATAIA
jgi:hypothetical protein